MHSYTGTQSVKPGCFNGRRFICVGAGSRSTVGMIPLRDARGVGTMMLRLVGRKPIPSCGEWRVDASWYDLTSLCMSQTFGGEVLPACTRSTGCVSRYQW